MITTDGLDDRACDTEPLKILKNPFLRLINVAHFDQRIDETPRLTELALLLESFLIENKRGVAQLG
jgi:hypothetical protein